MAKREIDPEFDLHEKLWRRIEKGSVRRESGKPSCCKPSAFRLQVSLVREKHGAKSTVCKDKWNGIAEATAEKLAAAAFGDCRIVCVDEPMDDEIGHCLAAVVIEPGKTAPPNVTNAVREHMAKVFAVVDEPT